MTRIECTIEMTEWEVESQEDKVELTRRKILELASKLDVNDENPCNIVALAREIASYAEDLREESGKLKEYKGRVRMLKRLAKEAEEGSENND